MSYTTVLTFLPPLVPLVFLLVWLWLESTEGPSPTTEQVLADHE